MQTGKVWSSFNISLRMLILLCSTVWSCILLHYFCLPFYLFLYFLYITLYLLLLWTIGKLECVKFCSWQILLGNREGATNILWHEFVSTGSSGKCTGLQCTSNNLKVQLQNWSNFYWRENFKNSNTVQIVTAHYFL